ncbi:MAG: 5-formyltetrahydrofolate cyclo-ligase [Burkholderiales bacterium]|nr:5-formyltetrahydrofolate cyclo-ligase [Burkholderiales bacterium]
MTAGAVVDAKKAARRRVLALRDTLTGEARAQKSAIISARLVSLPEFVSARAVAGYVSFGTEFDTAAFLDAVLATGKRLLLPRVERESHRIQFHFVADLSDSLTPGPWGIREPDPSRCPAAPASNIDFMLVPGVAFTPQRARLGYGGGFYDAAIGTTRVGIPKVAAAFSVQIVDSLPVEAHDRRVDLIVTEDAEYGARQRDASSSDN